jgi:hypothetical protein
VAGEGAADASRAFRAVLAYRVEIGADRQPGGGAGHMQPPPPAADRVVVSSACKTCGPLNRDVLEDRLMCSIPRVMRLITWGSMVRNQPTLTWRPGAAMRRGMFVPGVHMQAHTQDPPLQPLIDGGDQGAQFRAGVVAGGQPRPGLRTPACEVAT